MEKVLSEKEIALKVASDLLQIKAIKLSIENPFTVELWLEISNLL